ncbi:hypothetical protein BJY18_005747 [Amycolatopsis jiangsuensis]|uniref:Uncharacterized protein n=1 Tax=Amycolatopsis jiangsuensis TaxID=1181879 RepID=A0A840J4C0_9PSEU|nr:hypothetical protein [Amycolatopsis jiangsuensis]
MRTPLLPETGAAERPAGIVGHHVLACFQPGDQLAEPLVARRGDPAPQPEEFLDVRWLAPFGALAEHQPGPAFLGLQMHQPLAQHADRVGPGQRGQQGDPRRHLRRPDLGIGQGVREQELELPFAVGGEPVGHPVRARVARFDVDLRQQLFGGHLLQRVVDRARLDVRPLVGRPGEQLAAHLVAVRPAGHAHHSEHEQTRCGHRSPFADHCATAWTASVG